MPPFITGEIGIVANTIGAGLNVDGRNNAGKASLHLPVQKNDAFLARNFLKNIAVNHGVDNEADIFIDFQACIDPMDVIEATSKNGFETEWGAGSATVAERLA